MEEDAIATRSHIYDEQTKLKAHTLLFRFAKSPYVSMAFLPHARVMKRLQNS